MKKIVLAFPILLSGIICLLSSCVLGDSTETDQKKETPQKEATITIRLDSDPGGLEPYLSTNSNSRTIYRHIFPTLLNTHPKEMVLAPVLAKALPEIVQIEEGELAGGTSYTYEIHEAAKWDDGRPVLASDYAFTLKVILNPLTGATRSRSTARMVKDFRTDPDNPRKFTLSLKTPHPLGDAITGGMYIHPAHLYDPDQLMEKFSIQELSDPKIAEKLAKEDEALKQFAKRFNGVQNNFDATYIKSCGAYKVEEYTTDNKIVLTKKENWWGDALTAAYPMLLARPDKLIFKPIIDNATAATLLKDGEIDIMSNIKPSIFTQLKANQDKGAYKCYSPQLLQYAYISMNNRIPALEDKNVRKALAHLTDVDNIINVIAEGLGQRVTGPIHPSKSYYNKTLQPKEFSIEKAKKLLAESGWKDSNENGILDKKTGGQLTELALSLQYGAGGPLGENIAILLKESAKKAGIEITINQKESTLLFRNIRQRTYELAVLMASQYPGFDNLHGNWHSSSAKPGGSNYSGFGNAESDALIEQSQSVEDEKERSELMLRIQELIYEEQPYVFIYTPLGRIVISSKIKDAFASSARPGYFPNWYTVK